MSLLNATVQADGPENKEDKKVFMRNLNSSLIYLCSQGLYFLIFFKNLLQYLHSFDYILSDDIIMKQIKFLIFL